MPIPFRKHIVLSVRVFGMMMTVLYNLDHQKMTYVLYFIEFCQFVTMEILRYLMFLMEMLLAGLNNLKNYCVCTFYINLS